MMAFLGGGQESCQVVKLPFEVVTRSQVTCHRSQVTRHRPDSRQGRRDGYRGNPAGLCCRSFSMHAHRACYFLIVLLSDMTNLTQKS